MAVEEQEVEEADWSLGNCPSASLEGRTVADSGLGDCPCPLVECRYSGARGVLVIRFQSRTGPTGAMEAQHFG
jgi:hypothetical protein